MDKIAIVVLWLVSAASFFVAMPWMLNTIFYWLFIFLVVAHAIECAVFFKRVMKAEGNKFVHLVMVFVFGVVHAKTLPE